MITMGKMRTLIAGVLIFLTALITQSCASIHITDEWRDKAFQRSPYKKIMVVALTKLTDLRQALEDEFSLQIKAHGGDASACYACILDVDKISREELARIGAGMGIEAYLVVIFLRTDIRIESSQSNPPPNDSYGTDSMLNMHLWGIPDLPLQKRSEVVTLESLFYDGESSKLIWRSTIESVVPSWEGSGIPKFVRAVLSSLREEKLIP
jgi:hypothetical protein